MRRVNAARKFEGKVRVTFRWESMGGPPMPPGMPGGDPVPPPEYVTFKITASGGVSANRNTADMTLPHNADGEVVEVEFGGEGVEPPADPEAPPPPPEPEFVPTYGRQKGAFKTFYKTVAVQNGKVTSPWVDMKIEAKVGGDRYDEVTMANPPGMPPMPPMINPWTGMLSTFFTINFEKPVEKYVQLSRAGAPAPKKEDDPTLNKDIDTWVESDGTVHGHTTYSHNSTITPPPQPETWPLPPVTYPPITIPIINTQSFNSALSGYWSNSTTWSWSPSDTTDTKTTHSQGIDMGTMHLLKGPEAPEAIWNGTPTGTSQKIIVYTATDPSDGFSLRVRNIVSVHDEWEVKEKTYSNDQEVIEKWHPFSAWTSNAIYPPPIPTPDFVEGKYGYTFDSAVTQEYSKQVETGAKGQIDAGISANKLVPWLTAKGVTLGVTGEAHIAVASKQVTEQTNNQNMTYTVSPPISVPPGWEARPEIQVVGKREKFKIWKFGPSGFLSEGETIVDTTDETPFRPMWEVREIGIGGGGQGN